MMASRGTTPTALALMDILDSTYYRSHGRKPRGRGSWAFCPWSKQNALDYLQHTIFSPGGMTFTEAKRWARRHASDPSSPLAGVRTVAVMP
jgi:hypothetical protein